MMIERVERPALSQGFECIKLLSGFLLKPFPVVVTVL